MTLLDISKLPFTDRNKKQKCPASYSASIFQNYTVHVNSTICCEEPRMSNGNLI
jgi:hypothetical protein